MSDIVLVEGNNQLNVQMTPHMAEFVVSNLEITPTEVNVGETVYISVIVTNVGNAAGSYEVTCEVV